MGEKLPSTYWLTRFAILRLLGLVYFVAFLILVRQGRPLLGHDGLLPADQFLSRAAAYFGSGWAGFLQLPSLFWWSASDSLLLSLAWLGSALSLLVLIGYANALVMFVLWGLYLSFVHIGQDWYSYGWEIQLLETGFLAIFLCPLWDARPFPKRPPPAAVVWLFRWITFRLMLGAGLIKIRGDSCWRDLTCLYYHYETQPIPNPLSRFLHFMPGWFHQSGVLYNHLCELVAPWFSFWPRTGRHVAGGLMAAFQIILIASGNLSFLNWLTIVPILACFDDSFWRKILPGALVARADRAAAGAKCSLAQQAAAGGLAVIVGLLSLSPAANLISSGQIMNTSFDRLHLVNTYGAFGSVGRTRDEIIFQGTADREISDSTEWKEYEFPCKPGDPMRRPCLISPYHYRLDWQIWFAAMAHADSYPWTYHLAWKLLHNDAGALSLLAGNPFPDKPPRYIRAELYRYEFAPPGDPSGAWWKRRRVGPWLPVLSADDPELRRVLAGYGWLKDLPQGR